MVQTAEALRALGVTVDVSLDKDVDLAGYDVVHMFNLTRPQDAYPQMRNAKRQGRATALSTIYWYSLEYESMRGGLPGLIASFSSTGQIEYFKMVARAV